MSETKTVPQVGTACTECGHFMPDSEPNLELSEECKREIELAVVEHLKETLHAIRHQQATVILQAFHLQTQAMESMTQFANVEASRLASTIHDKPKP